MNKYRIVYWYSGNKCVCEIEAASYEEARYLFYMNYGNDDIISINLVEGD